MSVGKKETVSITTFKKWPFSNDFRIETEDVESLSALCKFCFKVEYTYVFIRNWGQASKLLTFSRFSGLKVTYWLLSSLTKYLMSARNAIIFRTQNGYL